MVDGELVVFDTATGRPVFPSVAGPDYRRASPNPGGRGRPANPVLFDVLADAGDDLTGQPLRQRRARLERLLADAPPALALCPQTTDVALPGSG